MAASPRLTPRKTHKAAMFIYVHIHTHFLCRRPARLKHALVQNTKGVKAILI